MSAKVEYFEDKAGEWRYCIKGGNGEKMVTSEGYTRKADAKRGLKDLLNAVVLTGVWDEEGDFADELASRLQGDS